MTVGIGENGLRTVNTLVGSFCTTDGGTHHEGHMVRSDTLVKVHGHNFSGNLVLYDGGSVAITGTISGSVAEGKMSLSYTEASSSAQLFECRATVPFKLKWRNHTYPANPVPKFVPIDKPNAQFQGKSSDADGGLDFLFSTSPDGKNVYDFIGGFILSCVSGGHLGVTFHTDTVGTDIDNADGSFRYAGNQTVTDATSGATYNAHVDVSGSFTGSGHRRTTAAGTMQISLTTSGGDSCVGDDPTWNATAS